MKIIRLAFAALLLAAIGHAGAQTNTFSKFAPATGILKGSSTSYVTTAAVAADIYGLWSGTCSASTFLRGDGACASASSAPGGANTQVQFNNSSVFGGSANFTWDNTNNALTLNGTGGGILGTATAKPLNLEGGNFLIDTTNAAISLGSNGTSGAGGAVTVQSGNAATTGAGGSLSLSAGNGAGSGQSGGSLSLSAGTPGSGGAAGVIGFYTNGAGTARALVNGDGGVTVGSPTGGSKGLGTVNTTGLYVNGTAVSTGGTPGGATSQVQYNSSGVFAGNSGFTYDGSGNIALTGRVQATGQNNQFGSTSNASFGLVGVSGPGTGYELLTATDSNGNSIVFGLNSSGSTQTGLPTGASGIGFSGASHPFHVAGTSAIDLDSSTTVTGTMNATTDVQVNGVSVCQSSGTNCPGGGAASTSATVTSTGCAANSGVTGYFAKSGNVSTLTISAFACTSNATTFSFTGFPATYQPAHQASCAALVEDNTVDGKVGSIVIANSGTITVTVASSSGGSWTASGTKGFNNAITCSYPLN